jgi:hypothetical protein
MVAGATHLIAEASETTPDNNIRFPGEFFITTGTFALG